MSYFSFLFYWGGGAGGAWLKMFGHYYKSVVHKQVNHHPDPPWLWNSVADPWHFGTDADVYPDSEIFISDIQNGIRIREAQKRTDPYTGTLVR